MMSIPFHNTGYGRRFFDQQLPELIKAINRLAKAQEESNELVKENIELSRQYTELSRQGLLFQQERAKINDQQHQETMEQNELMNERFDAIERAIEHNNLHVMKFVEQRIGEALGEINEEIKQVLLQEQKKTMEQRG
jgi:tetrahydromethanopterin S-methyltransferase subunit G